MIADEKQTVIDAVRRQIESRHPGGATLEVVTDEVRKDHDWWYVTVRPNVQPARRFEYYEALAEAENEILKANHLTVLLVPAQAE